MLFLLELVADFFLTSPAFMPDDFNYEKFKSDNTYKRQVIKSFLKRQALWWGAVALLAGFISGAVAFSNSRN